MIYSYCGHPPSWTVFFRQIMRMNDFKVEKKHSLNTYPMNITQFLCNFGYFRIPHMDVKLIYTFYETYVDWLCRTGTKFICFSLVIQQMHTRQSLDELKNLFILGIQEHTRKTYSHISLAYALWVSNVKKELFKLHIAMKLDNIVLAWHALC